MTCRLFLPFILTLSIIPYTFSQVLSSTLVSAVRDRLAESAHASWELGTRAEALLELDSPSYAVFSHNSLPPPSKIPPSVTSTIAPVFDIAKTIMDNRSTANGGISGPQPLIPDGSAADPASNGVAFLLVNWTSQTADHLEFGDAATDQLNYLYQVVPKTSDGAFSHRVSEVQLWSDFVYMVPPFLAYYGVTTRDRNKLVDAYNQISLYRNYLMDSGAGGMWKHVVLGSWNDMGHWSTGNGWAAAGMLRVLSTIQRSEFAKSLKTQQVDLVNWVKEIHAGIYPHLDSNHLFRNYADNGATFYDASSTALLASTVYRISVLAGDHTHIPLAEASRKAISQTNSTSGSGTQHITSDGWLFPVVDPYQFGNEGSNSPEGQAFVLEMQAAWRDWVAAGSKGVNGGGMSARRSEMRFMVPVAVGAAVMLS